MWARVKGKTENALLKLPFKSAFMFRPGLIQPLHGIKSKTFVYRASYVVLAPFIPLIKKFLPQFITTTEQVGRAMIKVAQTGAASPFLETSDINKQYYVGMGFRVPCRVSYGLPAALYTLELRSGKTVHPTLRRIAQQMAKTLQEKLPDLTIHADMDIDDWDVRRGLQDITHKPTV
jgi:hypothetical protein